MNTTLIISLLFCIFLLIIFINILYIKKIIKENKKIKKARTDELKIYFEEEWKGEEQKLHLKYEGTKNKLDQLSATLEEKEKRYDEVNKDLDRYKTDKIKEIDNTAAEYEQRKHILVSQSVDKYRDILIEQANDMMGTLTTKIDFTNKELEKIQAELEEERSRRAAINEEIRRQRAVEEQQDFYRIQLNPNDTNDIELLKSITPRLRHPEAINKVIWTGYYQKPLAELRKRVAIESSGVYKITRIKTGEIYIGQAVNVSTRWTDHVKAALGIGTLASSQLHRVMAEDGAENFLFELLEKTPKEKLRERESFYIDFYDSKTYGLNTIKGEQK